MNLKNVGFFKLHVEKILLGVCVLIAAAIVYFYMPAGAYSISAKVGSSRQADRPATPADLVKSIAAEAQRLEQTVRRNQPSLESVSESVYSEYGERLLIRLMRESVPTDQRLAMLHSGGLDSSIILFNGSDDRPYWLPELPAVAELIAHQDYAVLAEPAALQGHFQELLEQQQDAQRIDSNRLALEQVRAIDELISHRDPRDFRYVTVAGRFDLDDMLARFQAPPPSDEYRPVPQRLAAYRASHVTEVMLERQTWDPVKEQWGATARVPMTPGQIQIASAELNEDDPNLQVRIDQLNNNIVSLQEDLVSPEFPPVAEHSRPWLNPFGEHKPLTGEQRREIIQLTKEINQLRKRIDAEDQKMANQRQRAAAVSQRAARQTNQPGGGFADMMSPTGGGARRGRAPTVVRPQANVKTAEQRIEENIARLQEELDKKLTRYEELAGENAVGDTWRNPRRRQNFIQNMGPPGMMGGDMMAMEMMMMMGMGPGMTPPGANYQMPRRRPRPRKARPRQADQVVETDEDQEEQGNKIDLWAHDLTVKPGETYRYRIVLGLYNPLFHQRDLSDQQHKEHFTKHTIHTAPSEWTDSISVRPEPQWFLVDARHDSQAVKVEMWKVHDGKPHKAEFTLRAGDVIGGTAQLKLGAESRTTPVDLFVDAAIVDVHALGGRGDSLSSLSPVLRFVDLASGQLRERSPNDDRGSDDRDFYTSELGLLQGLDPDETTTSATRPGL